MCRFVYLHFFSYVKGGYPDLNRKLTVPHTVVLPIELHPPYIMLEWFEHSIVNTKNSWLTD